VAVCWAVVAVRFVTWATLQYVVIDRVVGIPVLATVRADVLPAFTAALWLLAVSWPTVAALDGRGLPAIVVLAVPGLVGVAVYGLVLRLLFPATWSDLHRSSAAWPFAPRGCRRYADEGDAAADDVRPRWRARRLTAPNPA